MTKVRSEEEIKKRKLSSSKIRKGDKVISLCGASNGQSGIVLSCSGDKAVVQGLNVRKKHVKASQANPKGGIIELEKPIHISNLCLCDENGAPIKLKVRTDSEGQRELYYLNSEKNAVVYRSLKKQNT